MKNFTNNFKQFTSHLSARWLIMALMLLVGTSSAWATMYVAGSMNDWNKTANAMSGSGTVSATFQLAAGTYEYRIVENGDNWHWVKTSPSSSSGVTSISNFTSVTASNVSFTLATSAVEYTVVIYYNTSTYTTYVEATLPATTYTISYDANGGTGAPADQTKNEGEDLTLSTTIPTLTGYTFTGWNTDTNGSGTTYEPGASYTTDADLTLYAQWEACPTIAAPDITASATICEDTQVTLSDYNGDNTNTVKWYSNSACTAEVTQSVTPTDGTKYYAKAHHEESGCYSSAYSTLTFTVNPKPTITITGNNSAVLYEDVVLTAATDGTSISWEITEGDGSLSSTTGNSVTLTSSSAGNVTVTATATLGSCTATDTHEVEFGEEDCTPIPSNDIQITFTHPAKNNNNAACQYWGFGYIFKDGVTPNNDRTNYLAVFPNKDQTSGSKTVTLSNVQTAEINVYLNAYHQYSNCRASTQVFTLQRGGIYSITISSDQQGNGNWEKVPSVTKTGSLTQNPDIIAPAVKMISAEYDEENDVIVAEGAVYKTGCGETFWGFQYSRNGQAWGTTDEYFIRPNTGNSLSVPGEFDYSFPIPGANGGETYYIRAYALNNYNGSYALSNAVYSATSLPVEIPSKTINSATISLVDSEGDPSFDTEVCPQSTVYLKVSYVGGDFTDFVAEENFPGTDLELENHDKTNNYAIFSFTATAAGTANITISNKSGSTVTPANGVNITLEDVQVVTPPIITINPESAMICQGDDATISIVEENQNYTYTIYKDGEALNPQSFTITEAGVYTVGATENVCNTSATSMPIELKVVSSDVKIGLEADNTAIGPWQPLKLTVTPAKGYEYTLEGLDGMVYTKEGDVYTIKIPRPNDWSPGNSGTQQELEKEDKVFTAKIKVSDEVFCGSKEVTVTLTDTEENCE